MYFVLMGGWNPLEWLFTLGGRFFNPTKGKQVLKRAESHHYDVKRLGILACNFSMFLKFLKGVHFRESLTESEQSVPY